MLPGYEVWGLAENEQTGGWVVGPIPRDFPEATEVQKRSFMSIEKIECHGKKHEGPKLIPVSAFRGWDLKHRHYAICRACRQTAPSARRRHPQSAKKPVGFAWRGTNGLLFERVA